MRCISRRGSEYDCLMALIPPSIWAGLSDATTNYFVSQVTSGKIKSKKHYARTSVQEIQDIFFARLDLIARGLLSIDTMFAAEHRKDWYPPKYRFLNVNGHLRCNIISLAHSLGEVASTLFHPPSLLVVDESMYEYLGATEHRRYIPRKLHQNGLLCYCLAGYAFVDSYKIPIVFDYEPYVVGEGGNEVSAQEAMTRLQNRFHMRHPTIPVHLVVDSAFGSFARMHELRQLGTLLSFSVGI